MIRIACVRLSALKRGCSLGKKEWDHVSVAAEQTLNDNMRQQLQMAALCFIPVALSIVATLLCLGDKGKVEEV